MLNHALLVEAERSEPGLRVRALLTEEWGLNCRKLDWHVFDLEHVHNSAPDLLVLVPPCCEDAPAVFRRLLTDPIGVPVLSVLPRQANSELFRMASQVADDFLLWPVREQELRQRLTRLLGSRSDRLDAVTEQLTVELGLTQLVGRDPAFLRVVNQLPGIAAADVPVVIEGETGTGKELCAQAIHFLSGRRDEPFIPVDCGAIPDHLFENELFGHAKGAFTDAHAEQKGLVALAAGGTLLFDEVDTLSPANQIKLLRFLQEGTYRPLGGQSFSQSRVRVMAATNRNLEQCIRRGEFRSDLYYRLDVLRVELPPLRDRRLDIPLLAAHHLQTLYAQPPTISPAARRRLASYEWPGNIRELFNVIHRASLKSNGRQLRARDITLGPLSDGPSSPIGSFNEARTLVIQSFERRYLEEILVRNAGNITRAAREAGKERRAFGRLIKKHGIDPKNI